ncbi:hypothetical protein LX36DRAFT_236471 [Colletotrichum falcatum]|nr:hypothetical protein LX36DRAFT_236471 [Colletotrichum falcatum]
MCFPQSVLGQLPPDPPLTMISVGTTTPQPSSTIFFRLHASASLRLPNTTVPSGAIVINNGAHNCGGDGTCQLQTQRIDLPSLRERSHGHRPLHRVDLTSPRRQWGLHVWNLNHIIGHCSQFLLSPFNLCRWFRLLRADSTYTIPSSAIISY